MPRYASLIDIDRLSLYHDKAKLAFASKSETTALSARVGALEQAGGEPNVIEAVKVNGTQIAVVNKAVNVPVPTRTSQLSNDSLFATQDYVNEAIGSVSGVSFEVVEELPQAGVSGTIYLVPYEHGADDAYDEYIWVDNGFEKIGSTEVDLSNYVQYSDITLATDAQVNALFAA